MKKLLIAIAALLVLCSATYYWANLTVNGSILKTDPTYTGTLTISHSANNAYQFSGDGPGIFMTAGAGNTVDFGPQTLTALVRGATFSSTTTGVNALATASGNVRLIYNTGGYRVLVGPNITDDGSTLLQVNGGIKGTTAQFTTGATAGYVMTSDASGNGTWQAPASGTGTGTTYTPTYTAGTNTSGVTNTRASYTVNGGIVTVSICGGLTTTASSSLSKMTASLPIKASNNTCGIGMFADNAGSYGYSPGIASIDAGDSTVTYAFWSNANAGGNGGNFVISIQYPK